MKTKLNLALRIISTVALALLTIAFLWLTHLAMYYLHYIGWCWAVFVATIPFLLAVICALGIVYLWTEEEEYCEWSIAKSGLIIKCSNRGYGISNRDRQQLGMSYCPHCGKKIRIKE